MPSPSSSPGGASSPAASSRTLGRGEQRRQLGAIAGAQAEAVGPDRELAGAAQRIDLDRPVSIVEDEQVAAAVDERADRGGREVAPHLDLHLRVEVGEDAAVDHTQRRLGRRGRRARSPAEAPTCGAAVRRLAGDFVSGACPASAPSASGSVSPRPHPAQVATAARHAIGHSNREPDAARVVEGPDRIRAIVKGARAAELFRPSAPQPGEPSQDHATVPGFLIVAAGARAPVRGLRAAHRRGLQARLGHRPLRRNRFWYRHDRHRRGGPDRRAQDGVGGVRAPDLGTEVGSAATAPSAATTPAPATARGSRGDCSGGDGPCGRAARTRRPRSPQPLPIRQPPPARRPERRRRHGAAPAAGRDEGAPDRSGQGSEVAARGGFFTPRHRPL